MSFDIPIQANASGGIPIQAFLLVSDHCNHACVHCYQVHGRKGEMSLAEIEGVLDELERIGVLFLSLSGGETTLRPDLDAILRAARARGFAIILHTNGYAVSEAIVQEIERSGVWQVRISVYSDVAEEHDRVTLVPGSFVRTIDTIRKLRAQGTAVTMAVALTSHASADASRFQALAASLDCGLEMTALLTAKEDGSQSSLAVNPTADQLGSYFQAALEVPIPSREAKLAERPCGACSSGLTIHSNGSVRPCTHIPFEFVDVVEHGPGAIANIAKTDAFRVVADIRWRDIHGCRDCALVSYCTRCHGSASFESGDLFGPQPSACREAVARYEALVGALERAPVGSEIGRPDGVGPFAVDGAVLRAIPDEVSEADQGLAQRFPWIRPDRPHLLKMTGLIPAKSLVRRHVTQPFR